MQIQTDVALLPSSFVDDKDAIYQIVRIGFGSGPIDWARLKLGPDVTVTRPSSETTCDLHGYAPRHARYLFPAAHSDVHISDWSISPISKIYRLFLVGPLSVPCRFAESGWPPIATGIVKPYEPLITMLTSICPRYKRIYAKICMSPETVPLPAAGDCDTMTAWSLETMAPIKQPRCPHD